MVGIKLISSGECVAAFWRRLMGPVPQYQQRREDSNETRQRKEDQKASKREQNESTDANRGVERNKKGMQEQVWHKIEQKEDSRSGSLVLRACCTCFLPNHKGPQMVPQRETNATSSTLPHRAGTN